MDSETIEIFDFVRSQVKGADEVLHVALLMKGFSDIFARWKNSPEAIELSPEKKIELAKVAIAATIKIVMTK